MHLPYAVAYMAGWFNTKLSLAFGKVACPVLVGADIVGNAETEIVLHGEDLRTVALL